MIHPVLKLQDSIDEAPEQGTDIELIPTLEYRPKANLEDNNDLTSVVSNDNINAEISVPDANDKNGEMHTNPERMQLSIDHPTGKNSFDNAAGSSNGNQMRSAIITHASKDMQYNPKEAKMLANKQCETIATEKSSPNTVMKRFAKIHKFLPSRRPELAKIGQTVSFLYSLDGDPSGYWLEGTIMRRKDRYCDAI